MPDHDDLPLFNFRHPRYFKLAKSRRGTLYPWYDSVPSTCVDAYFKDDLLVILWYCCTTSRSRTNSKLLAWIDQRQVVYVYIQVSTQVYPQRPFGTRVADPKDGTRGIARKQQKQSTASTTTTSTRSPTGNYE